MGTSLPVAFPRNVFVYWTTLGSEFWLPFILPFRKIVFWFSVLSPPSFSELYKRTFFKTNYTFAFKSKLLNGRPIFVWHQMTFYFNLFFFTIIYNLFIYNFWLYVWRSLLKTCTSEFISIYFCMFNSFCIYVFLKHYCLVHKVVWIVDF